MSRFARFLVCCVLLFGALALPAQTTTTGAINGVIADQTGAVISGATIVLTNTATGSVQKAKSAGNGAYRFDLVDPGTYKIVVDQPGFEKLESTLTVDNSQVVAANVKLTIGSDQQTVEVSAVAALINAENGNVANTVNQIQVEEIPNSGNNLLYETKITPGFNNGGAAFGVIGNTSYQIDGENFNDPANNANNSGASNLTLGLDDVKEATVTGNGYSGQFGGLVGANVSYVTKSGGNRVHGDLNYYWTGRALVANSFSHKEFSQTINPATGLPQGPTPRTFENANQWAGQISGPVFIPKLFNGHDKLFFLVDAEGLRALLPAGGTTVTVPSPNFETYTLNKLQATGLGASVPYYKQIFALYDAARTLHNAQPGNPNFTTLTAIATGCPTNTGSTTYLNPTDLAGLGTNPGACADYYSGTAISVANEALEIYRVDYNASARDKMFWRFEHDNGFQPTSTDQINPIFNAISIQPQDDGQFNETHLFGTKATNNLIVAGLWYGAIFGPANINATTAVFPATQGFSDGTFTTLGGSDHSYPQGRNITTIQLQDDFAINYGAHTVKVGAKAYYIKENDYNFSAGTIPGITSYTIGSFINGGYDPAYASYTGTNCAVNSFPLPAGCTATTDTYASTFAQSFPVKKNHPLGEDQWAVYAEDDWKASHSFSLTYALRLEHQGNVKCLDNCLTQLQTPFPSLNHSYTIPYNQAYAFNQRSLFPGLQVIEFEPRVGFAYNPPIMHESMVIRGGYGIFYDGLSTGTLDTVANNPPQKPSFSIVGPDFISQAQSSNLWQDATAYQQAYVTGFTNGGTVTSIKASLPLPSEQAAFTPPTLYTEQPNFKMYNVQKWNLEIQKQMGKYTVLSVNYLGNHGTHKPYTNAALNAFNTPNQTKLPTLIGLPTGTAPITGLSTGYTPIDPRFGIVDYYVSGGSNSYNGVIVGFTQKFGASGGLINAGYTYGHLFDNGVGSLANGAATGTTDIGGPPDPFHPNTFWGTSASDIRHNFVVSYVYKAPFGRGARYLSNVNGLVDGVVSGWEVSGAAYAYSGLPFTVIDTATASKINGYATGAYAVSLPASLVNPASKSQGTCGYGLQVCLSATQFITTGTNAINTAAFYPGSNMNQARNQYRGPMYVSTDFAATKAIPLHWEGGRFSVAAQAFNVLNHLNFSRPTGSLNSSSFAKITSTVNPSGIFSGVGGDDSPRIVQLKAKLVF
jgi:hypothetical protein